MELIWWSGQGGDHHGVLRRPFRLDERRECQEPFL